MTKPEMTAAEVEKQLQARWPETRIEPSLVRMNALMELMDEATLAAVHSRDLEPVTALVRRSSLEDVFLHLTGRTLVD